ncbi:MAG: 3-oxoacyl-[acyl-carrier-protein] reductase [Eubacteriales bacterium]|nr:3-oxoacyl-[acyl-carrier-protein] reductase [Eubacteriales bacterium]
MLKGKTALITGASKGIGKAIALTFAAQGANVALIYASHAAQAQDVCDEAQKVGVMARCFGCDVSDAAQVKQTVQAVLAAFGALDILVNNAGITADGLIPHITEEAFDRVLAINLKGAFLMTQQAYRIFLRNRGGRIINITSVSGMMGNAGQANYAAAKAGMIGLTKTTAKELAPRGITCNAIAPGFIQTDMTRGLPDAVKESAVAQIPLKRMGAAQEVAHAAAFLASDQAAYITGAVLQVDGGLYM